jgi:hypothetical protein
MPITFCQAGINYLAAVAVRPQQRPAPLPSINPLMRPRTEPDNAETQHREDGDIQHCINHGSLH